MPPSSHPSVTNHPKAANLNCGTVNRNPPGMSLRALWAEDFATHDRELLSQGFWALFWHRFGNWRMTVRPWILRAPLSALYAMGHKASQWFCGIDLPYTVVVGRRVKLEHFGGMILIARAIGDDVIIRQNTTFGIATTDRPHDRPTIESGVDIGANAVVIGDVTVGAGARIGAGAVVVDDQPANALIAGVPARVIRPRQAAKRSA